jgi:hypothetical protein
VARRHAAKKRTARALEVGDGRPLLSHHVDQGGVKRVCGAYPLPQGEPFFFRLLLFGFTFGVGDYARSIYQNAIGG